MNISAAQEIVANYLDILENISSDTLAYDISKLPYSVAVIKYAFFVLIETAIEDDKGNDEFYSELINAYAVMDFRLHENADEVNKAYKKIMTGKIKDKIEEDKLFEIVGGFRVISKTPNPELYAEVYNFVVDCNNNKI